tara:strand:+ start:1529 stop:2449 length:921 start_codon:yes stop_codon:yes gene_type:complete
LTISIGLFLTSRHRGFITGGFIIRDRRRKPDEPFNPFAANANQVRQKKRSERSHVSTPQSSAQGRPAPRQSVDQDELRKKQEEARRRLGSMATAPTPVVQKPAVNSSALHATTTVDSKQSISRADRLAELRKQSQESVKKTESILEPIAPQPETVDVVETPTQEVQIEEFETATVDSIEPNPVKEEAITVSKNVFKQIVTQTPKKREGRRRRSRHDDSGGGRQPKVKKLNRQRYNDYKYAARDILSDERVGDEHRSNLLGQIWAKGERIGVDASFEFIEEKQEQLIISEDIAQQLKDLVKALTTRR